MGLESWRRAAGSWLGAAGLDTLRRARLVAWALPAKGDQLPSPSPHAFVSISFHFLTKKTKILLLKLLASFPDPADRRRVRGRQMNKGRKTS